MKMAGMHEVSDEKGTPRGHDLHWKSVSDMDVSWWVWRRVVCIPEESLLCCLEGKRRSIDFTLRQLTTHYTRRSLAHPL
jgi:hypothetical protein